MKEWKLFKFRPFFVFSSYEAYLEGMETWSSGLQKVLYPLYEAYLEGMETRLRQFEAFGFGVYEAYLEGMETDKG